MSVPIWLSLLSPIPSDAKPQRKPVASAEMLANGTAGPIAGWVSVSVHLSEPQYGLRHILITLDENGQLLSGSDLVMFVREVTADDVATLTDHESVGGRFEKDGSFMGTHWKMTLESDPSGDDEKSVTRSSEKRTPTEAEVASLRQIIADVLSRA